MTGRVSCTISAEKCPGFSCATAGFVFQWPTTYTGFTFFFQQRPFLTASIQYFEDIEHDPFSFCNLSFFHFAQKKEDNFVRQFTPTPR